MKPPFPENETERLESLRELHLLDSPAEERFDRITRLTSNSLQLNHAAVSLIDADRQWFKSCTGLDITQTSRDVAFCSHAILDEQPLIVPDAREDERFKNNPLVTGEPYIRFYASIPLRAPDGHNVGTLCVFDPEPREIKPVEMEILEDLAGIAESEIHLDKLSEAQSELIQELETTERQASTDDLTRLWNRGAIEEILEREIHRARRKNSPLSIAMLDIDHFKEINDRHGHLIGDQAIKGAAAHIRKSIRPYDAAGRFGGEEFLVILIDTETEQATRIANRICSRFRSNPIQADEHKINMTVSIGLATRQSGENSERFINRADEQLYRAKNSGRDCICSAVDDVTNQTKDRT